MRYKFRSYQIVVPVTSSPTLLLPANPHRSAWLTSNMGPLPVVLTAGQQPVNGQGVVLMPGVRPIEISEYLLGNWAGLDLWGQTTDALSVGGQFAFSNIGHDLDASTTGVKLSLTVAGTGPFVLAGATVGGQASGGAVAEFDFQMLRGATTYTVAHFVGNGTYDSPIQLDSGDVLQLSVAVTGPNFDGFLSYYGGNPGALETGATVVLWAAEHCGSI